MLILGGTAEAADLAGRLAGRRDLKIITSLAGRTVNPHPPAGETRIGGFGGVDGLSSFLAKAEIDLLIDATHPFAETISANAAQASRRTGTPLMSLVRAPWTPISGDDWRSVVTLEEARAQLPPSARAFLALGRQHIDVFAAREDVHFVIRMVDPPAGALPFRSCELILGKPGSLAEEVDLLRSRAISHLVCRNAGGQASYAKIEAARRLSVPVIMLERPGSPAGKPFATVDEVVVAIG